MGKTIIMPVGETQRSVFDATQSQIFRFTYNGDQVVRNRLVVRLNSNDALVFDDEVDSMRLEHTVPAGTLTNGNVYNARITVTYRMSDGSQEEDSPSDMIVFSCYATPSVTFDNLHADDVISNSAFGVVVRYSQAQSDLPSRYQVRLYDASRREIWTSGEKYPAPESADFTVTENISNLQNENKYYLQCGFESVSGMVASSGLVEFYVHYLTPSSYSTLYVENDPEQYAIRIRSNIKVVDGIIYGPEPTYIDNEMIDLSSGDTTVEWVDFGTVVPPYQILIDVCRDDEDYHEILWLRSRAQEVTVKIMRARLYGESIESLYAVIYSFVGGERWMTTSNLIPVPAQNQHYLVSVVDDAGYLAVELIAQEGGV